MVLVNGLNWKAAPKQQEIFVSFNKQKKMIAFYVFSMQKVHAAITVSFHFLQFSTVPSIVDATSNFSITIFFCRFHFACIVLLFNSFLCSICICHCVFTSFVFKYKEFGKLNSSHGWSNVVER